MRLQPLTLSLGVLLGVLSVLSLGAFQQADYQLQPPHPHAAVFGGLGPVQVEGVPTPQQMMRVVEGQPFAVPAGKVLVCTGVGRVGNVNAPLDIRFDGSNVLVVWATQSTSQLAAIPQGLVAASGVSVSVFDNGGSQEGVLLGYLADA